MHTSAGRDPSGARPVRFEFHISRQARDLYQFDENLFSFTGNVIFANFHAARVFAARMNERRDVVSFPERAVRASQINAMGLIDEILHFVIALYRQQQRAGVFVEALEWIEQRIGKDRVDQTLRRFAEDFPPLAVYRREIDLDDYLSSTSQLPGGAVLPNRAVVLEELLMLWIANANPAFAPFIELFDDSDLSKVTAYREIISELHDFFEQQPPFGPDMQNLVDMLRSPAIAVPHSLGGQLEYIRTRWAFLLSSYLYRLLSSLDLIKEEEKATFGTGGGGPSLVYDFGGLEQEVERFSPDREWMPKVVLLAKNTYVWLDQLSKKYRRPIARLDEIPDEELDTLARWGITGLWLIGLWERSPASKTIKQLRGNPDAVASAYSLFDYEIARDLGGEEAYQALRDRAWVRGIRLASDMVPNHMGIDSPWVIEHPEWFISLDYSPFPSYTFNGPNLSWDSRVGIYLEDHYFDNSDAAVVFKRVDFQSGREQYIYHGNDGTSMPWNDTAQLNYLRADVREAVIQTILHVARKFPIIRFDAAMTLAKKHYQRLWFPEPGSGGDIPSRADHSMTREQFDALFPNEFWREVVDRVAREVPDTLLLAEAFWMMEGYFVRTLGMHRVYNSAFMNMLRDEKNQEYRQLIKNTLEFDPEILKRYVNFMNNPDERTAVDQFGKGDKYFGVCVLMATLPGLPMIGHGQIEGYTEKYGMEFRRAYWDERPDAALVDRHEREIFPLLRRRYLFAGVENFLLYDFFTTGGTVNEDVFAFSNRVGEERGLTVYHNKYASTQGWIRTSAAFLEKDGAGGRRLVQRTLGEGLNLHRGENYFTIFRDQISGLQYIRSSRDLHEQGLYLELNAYKYHVFIDFYEVEDNQWRQYARLNDFLAGRGVPSIDETLKEVFLQPVHRPFQELINPGSLNWLIGNRWRTEAPPAFTQALDEAVGKMTALLNEIRNLYGGGDDPETIAREFRRELGAALRLPALGNICPLPRSRKYKAALRYLFDGPEGEFGRASAQGSLPDGDVGVWGTLLGWLVMHHLGRIAIGGHSLESAEQSRTWISEWLLGKITAGVLKEMGVPEGAAGQHVTVIRLLTGLQLGESGQAPVLPAPEQALQRWLRDSEFQQFLGVNRYQDILWFNKEAFECWLWWVFAASVIELVSASLIHDGDQIDRPEDVAAGIITRRDWIRRLQNAAVEAGYRVEGLLAAVRAQ